MNRSLRVVALTAALVLAVAACGGEDEPGTAAGTGATETAAPTEVGQPTTTPAPDTPTATAEPTGQATAAAGCDPQTMALHEQGTLTVATGEPVFEPWMVDDDPSNQQGFESALVYALADELGFAAEDVTWVRTGFDEAIAPGDKPYDFNIQQYSITAEREEVVDFSIGYYEVEQALVAAPDSPAAEAGSIGDLTSARLGAAIGTTSLDYVEDVIQPDTQAMVYDDNAAAKAAFDAGQVDALVFDLPTAYYITAVEIPDAEIVGVLPRLQDDPEELGLLFEQDSELVDCVDQALQALHDDGTIADLEDEWLTQAGSIPTLSE